MPLQMFLMLLALLFAGVLASWCCSIMSLLLLVLPSPMPEKSFCPWRETFYITPCRKSLAPSVRPGPRLIRFVNPCLCWNVKLM